MSEAIQIFCVPPSDFGKWWPHVGGLLLRGMHTTKMAVLDTMDRIRNGAMQLWLVSDGAGVLAAFLTEIAEDAGRKVMTLGALAGEAPKRWAVAVSDRVGEYARAEGCEALRCYGSEAWSRLAPSFQVIGERDGVAMMEQAP